MKKTLAFTGWFLASVSLAGCAVEPYPYNGGAAPYYGTTVAPGYAYGETGFFPYYGSQHIYSNYNNGYWRHQYGAAHGAPQGRAQGRAQAHGGGNLGGGHR